MRRALALVALVVVVAGCGEGNVLEEGEVIGKEYDDPDTWEDFECIAYKSDLITCAYYGYVTHHDGPHWYLDLHGYDDENKEREERHEVTQTLHDMVQVGQTVNLTDQSIVPK